MIILLHLLTPMAAAQAASGSDSPPSAGESGNAEQVTTDAPVETITLDSEELPPVPLSSKHKARPVSLETIIVTATKREAAVRDIPASIGVFSGEELESRGALELRDFLTTVPGIQQTEVFTEYNRISVRGIQADSAAVTPAATGYFVDDVPFSDPFVLHARPDLPPFDLEAVEVLKGPQGTLFGASALAGALRFRLTDAQPGIRESHGFIQYQNQADGLPNRAGGLALNLPLGADAAVRLVGVSRLGGGRIDDLRSGESDTDISRRYSGRMLLRWDGGGDWSLGLKGISQRSAAQDVPVAETTDGRLERERALRKAPTAARFNFATADLAYRMGRAELVAVSSVVDKSSRLSGENGARGFGVEAAGQPVAVPTTEDIQGFVQELRLVSTAADSAWEWLAGLYLHRYVDFTTQRVVTIEETSAQELVLLDFVADITAREYAAFAEVSRRLGRRWRLTTGLRVYRVKTAGEVVSTGAIILATGDTENRNDADIEASGINPKLAIQFFPRETLSIYLSVSRGFRFGGIQIIGPSPVAPDVPVTYQPDSLWNYELGLRTLWLDDRLSLDGAVFYIDWKDPQLQTTTGGAVPLNVVDNIGHARSIGGELSLNYRPPVRGLSLGLAAAYTDARSTEAYTTPSGAEAQAGARLPGTARHQLQAYIDYAWRWGGNQLALSLTHQRQGPGVSDILQNLRIYDYNTTDVRLRLSNPQRLGSTGISLGVSNLSDQRAVTQALVLSAENFTTMYNNTRMFDLRLDFRF